MRNLSQNERVSARRQLKQVGKMTQVVKAKLTANRVRRGRRRKNEKKNTRRRKDAN